MEIIDYGNNYEQVWLVEADCDAVRVISTTFQTERCYDYLKIVDSAMATVFYSGLDIVNQQVESVFQVKFISDINLNEAGFRLEWNCTERSTDPITQPPTECSYECLADCTFPTLPSTNFTVPVGPIINPTIVQRGTVGKAYSQSTDRI